MEFSDKDMKKKIIKVLSKHLEGLKITDVARAVGVNRHTVTNYLYEMKGAKTIFIRDLGTLKLCYLIKRKTKFKNKGRLVLIFISILFFVSLLLRPNEITLAGTPTPSVLPIINTPNPQNSTLAINFTCDGCNPQNTGELIKFYVCNDSSCTNCGLTNTYPASNATFNSSSENSVQVSPGNTLAHDNSEGYISTNDSSNAVAEEANWTWDLGSKTGNFSVKWRAKLEPSSMAGPYTYNVTVKSSVSAALTGPWTDITTATLIYPTTNYTSYYNDTIYGTYRYIRVNLYSNNTSMCNVTLRVDYARVQEDLTSGCWCNSSAVSGSPWCTYTNSTSCNNGTWNYWGRVCAFQYPWPWACNTTGQQTFTYKKNNGCSCTSNGECYSGCCQGNGLCGSDCTPPWYSSNSTNSTTAGTPVMHSLNWTDNVGLSGYIFSFDNCTGTLVNDSTWVAFGGSTWSNVTKTINSTFNCQIRWCVYANDTSNNWNGTSCVNPFSYITISPLTYSLNSTNSTVAGTPVSHNLYWQDNLGLSGYIFSFDNCTGTLINDTLINFVTSNFNQTQTTNITGTNTTSPTNLNILDGLTYNVTEAKTTRGFQNMSSDLESSAKQHKGDSTTYISMYSYNQSQTANITGMNTTPLNNNLNAIDGLTYNVTEGIATPATITPYNWTSTNQESGTNQSKGNNTLVTYGTGWLSPTTNTSLGTGWLNANAAFASGGNYAQGSTTEKTNYSGFYPNIPSDATIKGFQVSVYANESNTAGTNIIGLRLSNNSGVSFLSPENDTTEPGNGAMTQIIVGDAGNLWGLTWTVANTNNLAVNMSARSSGATRYLRVDWISVNITYQNYTESIETNTSWSNPYDGIDGSDYNGVDRVRVIITISNYTPSASNSSYNNNRKPDIEVGFYNGTSYVNGSYCNINNTMGNNLPNNTAWNCSIDVTDAQFLNSWKYQANRSVIIHGIFIDTNATIADEINVTGVYGYVDGWNSIPATYRVEIEHNATGVSYTRTLNSINVSLNFTTNVSSVLNMTIYNFNSGSWDYSVCQNGSVTANTWNNWWCNVTTNPFNYNSSNGVIRVRLNGTVDHTSPGLLREDYVQYYVNTSDTLSDTNTTNTTYNGIPVSNLYSTLVNITVTVNVSSYSNSGSLARGNSNPDLWLQVYNGTNWIDIGNMSVTTTGNFSKSTQDSTILSAWTNQNNRNISIKGVYLDNASSTQADEINYTDVWVNINSTDDFYRAEIEHNATVSYSGSLYNISVTANFTNNVTSTYNMTIYNFATGSWDYSVCNNGQVTANNWYSWSCNVTGNPYNYNSSDGKIRIRLNETVDHTSPGLLSEDYVRYTIYSYTTSDNWVSMSGIGNWSNVTKTINSTVGCTIRWCVYANDTSNNWNGTSCQNPFTYNTTQGANGKLIVSLIYPPTSSTTRVDQNSTFNVNATVNCTDAACGTVYGTVRYNGSSSNPDTPVNSTTGDKPFYNTSGAILQSCGNMNQNDFCQLNWTLNATGNFIAGWKIGVLFNSSSAGVTQNHTNNATINILECHDASATIRWNNIDFSNLDPNTTANKAPGNNNQTFNISNLGTCTLKIWIKGTDLTNTTSREPSNVIPIIGVDNITWSNTTNISANAYPMTKNYVILNSSFSSNIKNITTYYWLSIPPIPAGGYNGTITFCSNTTQSSGESGSC
jgi:hypothetical protein